MQSQSPKNRRAALASSSVVGSNTMTSLGSTSNGAAANSTSIEDIDELFDDDILCTVPAKHFLDYDSIPPPGFEDDTVAGANGGAAEDDDDDYDCSSTIAVKGMPRHSAVASSSSLSSTTMYPNEDRKVDKKYETDGEISDFELANGPKKQQQSCVAAASPAKNTGARRKKHFLDENPIAPAEYAVEPRSGGDYHRSLDRNYERSTSSCTANAAAAAAAPLSGRYDYDCERKHSLDRGERSAARRCGATANDVVVGAQLKETSFTMARFLEQQQQQQQQQQLPSMSASTAATVNRGTWPADRPTNNGGGVASGSFSTMPTSAAASISDSNATMMGPKVECVYSLLSMLGCTDQLEMSRKFYELSKSPDTCAALRHSRCIPLIVQMIHSDADDATRRRASQALHNVVNCHPDDKAGRREAKVLRHIEQIMEYCDTLKSMLAATDNADTSAGEAMAADDSDRHPSQAICSLMKISFDEEHRHAMCQLGALQAIASMVHYDHAAHGANSTNERCHSLRRYAGMALTNLTFGDGNNKALLRTNKDFMRALVAQLNSDADDLLQVTASVLRNLSWRPDNVMKAVLSEIGTVTALTMSAMRITSENTIKALLSALWNLSAHCSRNKAEFCAVDGALAFLVDMLVYEGPSRTMSIIENAGGILRNVSSHIAVRESYRVILRQRNCLGILLQQLSSESLTIVSNACGTLWNLSARCAEDQKFLLDNKAVPMLSLLIHSKHKMISNGSSAALKNLLNFRPGGVAANQLDPIAKSMRLKELPTLNVRKLRALEKDLDQNLAETCENIEITTPPPIAKEQQQQQQHKSMDDFLNMVASTTSDKQSSSSGRLSKSAQMQHQNDGKEDSKKMMEQSTPTPAPRRSVVKNKQQQPQKQQHREESPAPGTSYQETDLDQITDFSLRYGEHQPVDGIEDDDEDDNDEDDDGDEVIEKSAVETDTNEMLLILEDSVKCYETEGTPYVISNAASVSDLRLGGGVGVVIGTTSKAAAIRPKKMFKSGHVSLAPGPPSSSAPAATAAAAVDDTSGLDTPEKTTNYCEEGTPGYSIYDSYSSLEEVTTTTGTTNETTAEAAASVTTITTAVNATIQEEEVDDVDETNEKCHPKQQQQQQQQPTTPGGQDASIAFETPMMFSRHSSMSSLSSVADDDGEPLAADDHSSVVSDFSRLASGVMSPSDIPDSPSQMMHPQVSQQQQQQPPQPTNSPPSSRRTVAIPFPHTPPTFNNRDASIPPVTPAGGGSGGGGGRLRSVFEDDLNRFDVENTPAHFSCATSLSNLSLDDEPKIATDSLTKEMRLMSHPSEDDQDGLLEVEATTTAGVPATAAAAAAAVGISDSDDTDDDNMLLATCINIGMAAGRPATTKVTSPTAQRIVTSVEGAVGATSAAVPLDDSTSGSDIGNETLLEQCIREGIQRCTKPKKVSHPPTTTVSATRQQPPATFTSGGNAAHDDSLSSLSMDSEDDGLILRQAIAAGSQGKPKHSQQQPQQQVPMLRPPPTILPPQQRQPPSAAFTTVAPLYAPQSLQSMRRPQQHAADDSYSSIDSTDSNDTQHASLLEQCIQSGMHKQTSAVVVKPVTKPRSLALGSSGATGVANVPKAVASPKRSQLPTFKTPTQIERDRQKERDRKDEALLMECIQTGMTKVSGGAAAAQIKPPVRHVRQVLSSATIDYTHRLANLQINEQQQQHQFHMQHHPLSTAAATTANTQSLSKNGQTTSVAVSVSSTKSAHCTAAPGVVAAATTTTSSSTPIKIINNINSNNNNHHINNSSKHIITPATETKIHHHRQQHDGTNESKEGRPDLAGSHFIQSQLQNITTRAATIKIGSNNDLQQQQLQLQRSHGSDRLDRSNEYPAMRLSHFDFDDSSERDVSSSNMEISNEFMMDPFVDDTSSPIDREMAATTTNSMVQDKHKDPDLMLKSVDRLTAELVSTAEYLRTTASSTDETATDTTAYEKHHSKSSSSTTNTWNENTCPNDASFPSISMSVPVIAADDDDDDDETTVSDVHMQKMRDFTFDEATPTNEARSFVINSNGQPSASSYPSLDGTSQPDSLETESHTLVNDDNVSAAPPINFQVGGEVQLQFRSFRDTHQLSGYLSSAGTFSTFDDASSMTNSTIIANEANKLVTELLNNMHSMGDSSTSLDLDHIRPPSGMDGVSSYFDAAPQSVSTNNTTTNGLVPFGSPQLPRSRKKSLPLGLMARRALSHAAAPSGSLESVNSSCNLLLDNIKPPSIMDELLDSMISVASITSEVVDNNHQLIGGGAELVASTCYDTALSEMDDSTTMRSCYDLPSDSSAVTPIPSDFSSAETTPKKVLRNNTGGGIKRTLTPKQKRQMVKERYRTYTIAADMMLSTTTINDDDVDDDDVVDVDLNEILPEDKIQIEIVEDSGGEDGGRRMTPRQRRNEDRLRFQTQTLDPPTITQQPNGDHRFRTRTISSQDEDDPFMAEVTTTRTFKFNDTSSDSTSLDDDVAVVAVTDKSSLRALTERYKFIRNPIVNGTAAGTIFPPTPPPTANTPGNDGPPTFNVTTNGQHIMNEDSLDFEQNSETESCHQNHCIDDCTYTLEPAPPLHQQQPAQKIKPKISKPTSVETSPEQQQQQTTQENSKIIRGKKKAAYVSPYKKTSSTAATTMSARPLRSLPKPSATTSVESTKKSIAKLMPRQGGSGGSGGGGGIVVAKTHVLINKSNLTNKINASRTGIARAGFQSSTAAKTVTVKNQLNRLQPTVQPPSTPPPPAMPERQGTFVKDEPTVDGVPIVGTTSAPASPARSRLPSKVTTASSTTTTPTSPAKGSFISKLKNPLQRSASIGAAKSATTTTSRRTTPSSSTTDLQTTANKRRISGSSTFYRSPSTPTVPQRSNSNASLKATPSVSKRSTATEPFATQPPSRSNSNLTGKSTSNISSRIAGLWKKPEPKMNKPAAAAAAAVNGKPPPGNRLIRSSTFDNSPGAEECCGAKSNGSTGNQRGNKEVVRRVKTGTSNNMDETKRISRLGTFINVDEAATA